MVQTIVGVNEVQQLVLRVFGSRKITAITTGDTVVLTADTEHFTDGQAKKAHSTALNKLYGIFKDTNLLSSDDFAKNKQYEKILEEKMLNHE